MSKSKGKLILVCPEKLGLLIETLAKYLTDAGYTVKVLTAGTAISFPHHKVRELYALSGPVKPDLIVFVGFNKSIEKEIQTQLVEWGLSEYEMFSPEISEKESEIEKTASKLLLAIHKAVSDLKRD